MTIIFTLIGFIVGYIIKTKKVPVRMREITEKGQRFQTFKDSLNELCIKLSVELEPEDGHGAMILIDRKLEPNKAGFTHNLKWEKA